VRYHHHEVGPFGQQEIELGFHGLVRMADAALIVKSFVHNVSSEQGLTATFLPKPLHGQAGNGMHLHQYLVQGGTNLFHAEGGLSEVALCYIGSSSRPRVRGTGELHLRRVESDCGDSRSGVRSR